MKDLLLQLLTPNPNQERLTADEIEARVRAFVVVVVTLILAFIVFALLYSVTFVSQPIKAMAPIDQAYTKMLNDIVLLIVGGIGGIMTKGLTNEATAMMNNVKGGTSAYVAPPVKEVVFTETISTSAGSAASAPSAPSTPPMLEDDDERLRMAHARESVK